MKLKNETVSSCDWFKGFHSALFSEQLRCYVTSSQLFATVFLSSPFSRTDKRKCMPMHNLLQYRNCTLFKPTFIGDFRLAVSLCDSMAEAQAQVSSCQSHISDSNRGTRRLFNLAATFAQVELSMSWAHWESLVLLKGCFFSFFYMGRKVEGLHYRAEGWSGNC